MDSKLSDHGSSSIRQRHGARPNDSELKTTSRINVLRRSELTRIPSDVLKEENTLETDKRRRMNEIPSLKTCTATASRENEAPGQQPVQGYCLFSTKTLPDAGSRRMPAKLAVFSLCRVFSVGAFSNF